MKGLTRRLLCWCNFCGHRWEAHDDAQRLTTERARDVVDWQPCHWCFRRLGTRVERFT